MLVTQTPYVTFTKREKMEIKAQNI